MKPLLNVTDLMTYFFSSRGLIKAVRGLDFTIAPGETLALVGESGCGKSMTALSLLRLVPSPGKVVSGEVFFRGEDLRMLPEEEMQRIRGNEIAMVFQEPMTSLNPVFRIGNQLGEVLQLHLGLTGRALQEKSVELLHQVGISSPEQRLRDYPHQLSGGMRQRVMIAMALACDPALLIADEPTTALDVTIQAQIIDLLARLRDERNMATLLITHDFGVVAKMADRVAVMYNGLIMEYAPVRTLFANPVHPYTQGLMECIPKLGQGKSRLTTIASLPRDRSGLDEDYSFLDQCPEFFAPQRGKLPMLRSVEENHLVRCWST